MIRSERRTPRKTLALALALLLLLPAVPVRSEEGGVQPLTQAEARDQIVRVYLSRIGITDRIDLTLTSPYGLGNDGGLSMHFAEGSELSILLIDGILYVYYQGMSLQAGTGLTLTRYASGSESGFRLTNYPALYAGDLRLDIAENIIRPILSIHVEDYLLGVVPYEMSESFPLEALKAQAVAARTYALRKQNPKNDYDVVDTTNDQVYKGYLAGSSRVEQAVRETRGVCGFYKGKLAQCYYAASNGGQTELVSTVWPGGGDYGYYAYTEDAYDVENPASLVKTFRVKKKPGKNEQAPYGLRKLLADELARELSARGFDPTPESVRVDEVSAMSVDEPKGGPDSKWMTVLRLTVRVSGRTRTDAPVPMVDPDTEEVSLFQAEDSPVPTPAPFLPAAPSVSPDATPSPTPPPVYGKFTPIEQSFEMEIPIFPTAERALALDISGNYDNELWSVVESEDGFTVQARRYGHGVGMSQRGAEWMAARYQKTFQDILSFYYPGMELKQYPETDRTPAEPAAPLAATAGPPPTPTPRPTLMPSTMEAGEGQWFALVTGIDDGSTLNLRAEPDLAGDIVMRLFKNQRLLVLERCREEGWVKVRTDVAEGYVSEKFLEKESERQR